MNMSQRQEPQGLRLLSLDNGGIRGMTQLVVLLEILSIVQYNLGLPELPLPCECFDMIGGTGTGGLIALMLGRLHMSFIDAIKCYARIAREVFADLKPFARDERCKARKLEGVIQDIVKEKTGEAEGLMMNPETGDGQCKTFVCAVDDEKPNVPQLFRSYPAAKGQTTNCTIWEAVRATTTAPTLFKPITIGTPGSTQRFVDGGLGCNNPANQVLKEAAIIFPGRPVACILSLGAGEDRTIKIPPPALFQRSLPASVIESLKGLSTECETRAQEIGQRFENTPDVYFRFSVDRELQPVKLAEWERFHEVAGITEVYMGRKEVKKMLKSAALAIQGKLKAGANPRILGPKQLPTATLNSHDFGDREGCIVAGS